MGNEVHDELDQESGGLCPFSHIPAHCLFTSLAGATWTSTSPLSSTLLLFPNFSRKDQIVQPESQMWYVLASLMKVSELWKTFCNIPVPKLWCYSRVTNQLLSPIMWTFKRLYLYCSNSWSQPIWMYCSLCIRPRSVCSTGHLPIWIPLTTVIHVLYGFCSTFKSIQLLPLGCNLMAMHADATTVCL